MPIAVVLEKEEDPFLQNDINMSLRHRLRAINCIAAELVDGEGVVDADKLAETIQALSAQCLDYVVVSEKNVAEPEWKNVTETA
jgi:hypothetical protein